MDSRGVRDKQRIGSILPSGRVFLAWIVDAVITNRRVNRAGVRTRFSGEYLARDLADIQPFATRRRDVGHSVSNDLPNCHWTAPFLFQICWSSANAACLFPVSV